MLFYSKKQQEKFTVYVCFEFDKEYNVWVRELFSLNLNFFLLSFWILQKKIKERKDFISIWEKIKAKLGSNSLRKESAR